MTFKYFGIDFLTPFPTHTHTYTHTYPHIHIHMTHRQSGMVDLPRDIFESCGMIMYICMVDYLRYGKCYAKASSLHQLKPDTQTRTYIYVA